MPAQYSSVVEDIFEKWLESLENAAGPGQSIDPNLIQGIKKLIEDGKIGSSTRIKQLIDEAGGKDAA